MTRTRHDIVELQVPATMLAALPRYAHPGWSALLADAQDRLARLPTTPGDHSCGAGTDATHRRARAELARWIHTRDRHCVAPHCRRRAADCDLDHTHDWAHGGSTHAANLGALCRHDHRAKHLAGWQLHQPTPGRFHWRTRAGTTYTVTPRPVTEPLPPPLPTPDGRRRPAPGPTPRPTDSWRTPTDAPVEDRPRHPRPGLDQRQPSPLATLDDDTPPPF